MPKILVVDDSAFDRRLVGGILEQQSDFQLDYATDGEKALACIETDKPDAVVTDLVMPHMDGFQLVQAVRSRFPAVPVILMTSQGNERIAADALAHGAASYVPKQELGADLADTIRNVLAVSSQILSHDRLMEAMTRRKAVFALPNESSLLASLVGYLQDQAGHLGLCDDAERIRLGVALEESLSNAMYHGNLEVDSCLKERDADAFHALVNQRRSEPPFGDRRIYVDADMTPNRATVIVRDEGAGFDPNSLPDPTDPTNLDRICGRGILLIRTFMDDVQYNDKGNQVTLTKLRKDNAITA
jgi:CheY-like chemotaxis protein